MCNLKKVGSTKPQSFFGETKNDTFVGKLSVVVHADNARSQEPMIDLPRHGLLFVRNRTMADYDDESNRVSSSLLLVMP